MPLLLDSAREPAPCARCLRRDPHVRWGDICADCAAELRRRATPAVRGISIAAALLVVFYAWRQIHLTPASRFWVAVVAVGTYFVVRRIAGSVAIELLRKRGGT